MGTHRRYAHARKPATVQSVRPLTMGDKGDALKEPRMLPTPSSQFSGLSHELMGEASSPSLVQAKLMVGPQGDKYEQEADRLAAAVVENMHSPGAPVAGQMASLPQVAVVQRNVGAQQPTGSGGMAAPPELEASILQARGSGHPLENAVRGPIEQSLGADLRGMRIHTDAHADQLNRSLQSRAFTTERDIFFRQGEYRPQSRSGQALLVHELVHGVQQGAVGERIQCAGDRNTDQSFSFIQMKKGKQTSAQSEDSEEMLWHKELGKELVAVTRIMKDVTDYLGKGQLKEAGRAVAIGLGQMGLSAVKVAGLGIPSVVTAPTSFALGKLETHKPNTKLGKGVDNTTTKGAGKQIGKDVKDKFSTKKGLKATAVSSIPFAKGAQTLSKTLKSEDDWVQSKEALVDRMQSLPIQMEEKLEKANLQKYGDLEISTANKKIAVRHKSRTLKEAEIEFEQSFESLKQAVEKFVEKTYGEQ